MAKKDETTSQYIDESTGPTGAKAFGPQSTATSTGAVIQGQTLESAESAALVAAFEQLTTLLKELQPADRVSLDETISAINQAKERATTPDAPKQLISSAWEKAKGWVGAALSVGTFVTVKAEQVRALITKITGLLS
jgi:hypothetical protein